MNNRQKTWLAFWVLGAFVIACSSGGFNFLRRGGQNPADTTVIEEVPECDGCGTVTQVTQTWDQPDEVLTPPVDFFFVEDTSGSLDDDCDGTCTTEREAVAAATLSFLSTLEGLGITDYCLGVVFGHAESQWSGALHKHPDAAAACLCIGDYSNQADLIEDFGRNLSVGEHGHGSESESYETDGGEAGLYSFYRTFTEPAKKAAIQAQGCFREGAAVVAAFVADENDISTTPNHSDDDRNCNQDWNFTPPGPATVLDGQCKEPRARLEYYSNQETGELTLDYSKVLDAIQIFQSPLPFVSFAVVYDETVPSGGDNEENERGWGYIEFAEESGGGVVDLIHATNQDQDAFNDDFEELAQLVAEGVGVETVFHLETIPCDGSIEVRVDNSLVTTWKFFAPSTVILPTGDAGGAGSVVSITYNDCG